MKKALVIINPSAGLALKQKTIKTLVVNKLSRLGYSGDMFELNKDFEKNIENYNGSKVDLVVAVGGDGTVKVAARTILQKNIKAPLAIIPFGSANVIAMVLGIPLVVNRALKQLDNIANTTQIDVGLINNRHYFLVGFSLGYISQVVTNTDEAMKKKLGFFSYVLRFMFNKIKIKKIKFKIIAGGRSFWIKGNSVVVFNALNYFGLKTKKIIDFQDGILNLYVLTNKTFFGLISAVWGMLWYRQPPKYVFSLDNSAFDIFLRRQRLLKTCQIDGDYVSLDAKKISIRILPRVLTVVKMK
ncbi:MAG TPA: diacylglycerol kinase family protein [bacterium]|nr:diacylglycerol kinase family protein [bacterium]HNS34184.1 diacylglycerol kinase family protein [bacterium]HNZ73471.1 diacylglycerol kinase family protein [bacterium]HOH67393.1 diacylglycerol kinase family protein [bacterium]